MMRSYWLAVSTETGEQQREKQYSGCGREYNYCDEQVVPAFTGFFKLVLEGTAVVIVNGISRG
jgi:hypothetical protein